MRPAILTGFHFSEATLAAFAIDHQIVGHIDQPDPALLPTGTVDRVQALITAGSIGASDALMASLPRLSLICCYGTGYERIDLAAARRRGVMVTHAAEANAADVAEMAVGLVLATHRRIARADRLIRRREWTKRIPERFGPVSGLTGAKFGILGLGAIGLEIAQRIRGFGVEIGYCNRRRRADVDYPFFSSAVELAAWAEILVVSLRADASNRNIVDAKVLEALGNRGHLVNISRGWAVDEAALAKALREGLIEGAAIDVFAEEPYAGAELLELENLVMTPHLGGSTEHAQQRMTSLVLENLAAHFAGQPVVTPLPELGEWAQGEDRPRPL